MSLLLNLSASFNTQGSGVPTLQFVYAAPLATLVRCAGAVGFEEYDIEASTSPEFNENLAQAITVNKEFEILEIIGTWYFRCRGALGDDKGVWSLTYVLNNEQLPIPDMLPVATAGNGQAILTYQDFRNAEGIGTFQPQYRTAVGEWTNWGTALDPEVQAGAAITVTGLINDTLYYFRFIQLPINVNYSSTNSSTTSATPINTTPTLTAPTNLNVAWGAAGECVLTWDSPLGTSWDVTINGGSLTTEVTRSRSFTGLTIGVNYTFVVIAKAAGYNNSPAATIASVAPDPLATFIDFDLEFAGEAYYKPLDGRREHTGKRNRLYSETREDYQAYLATLLTYKDYPLINVVGASVDNTLAPNTSKVTPTLSNVVEASDNGKKIALGRMHQNPKDVDYNFVDNYFPSIVATLYATIIEANVAENYYIIDKDINGGNRETPVAVTNGIGYVFKDNKDEFENLRNAVASSPNHEVRFKKFEELSNYKQRVYVITEYKNWVINYAAKGLTLTSGEAIPPAFKVGVEDYYQHEVYRGIRQRWIGDEASGLNVWFTHTNNYNFIFNIRLLPVHFLVDEGVTFERKIVNGRKSNSVTAIINAMQLSEYHALVAGSGLKGANFVTFNGSSSSSSGTLESTALGAMQGVATTAHTLFKNYEQNAPYFHQSVAAVGGSYMITGEDCIAEFPNEVNPPFINLSLKVTSGDTAYDGFTQDVISRKDSFFPYTFEITGGSSAFSNFSLGGSYRFNPLSIEGTNGVYTFTCAMDGNRADNPGEFVSYWESFYRGNRDRWFWNWANGVISTPSRTGSKYMVTEQIPISGTRYTVSREYRGFETWEDLIASSNAVINQVDTKNKTIGGTTGTMYPNVLRTAIAWTTVYQDYAANFINNDPRIPTNGKPLALQPGDTFTIPHYVRCKGDTTGILEGDTITGESLVTATVSSVIKRWEITRSVQESIDENPLLGHRLVARIDDAGQMWLTLRNQGNVVIAGTSYTTKQFTSAMQLETSLNGIDWEAAVGFTSPVGTTIRYDGYNPTGHAKNTEYWVRYRLVGGEFTNPQGGLITFGNSSWIVYKFNFGSLIWLDNYDGGFSENEVITSANGTATITSISSHNVATLYTCMRKDWKTGNLGGNPAEVVYNKNNSDVIAGKPASWNTNQQSYRYMWLQLDINLPDDIEEILEIKIVTSVSEELLDGVSRPAIQAYKSLNPFAGYGAPNQIIGGVPSGYVVGVDLTYNTKLSWHEFPTYAFTDGDSYGHLCYTQKEVSEYYRRVRGTGYYRQNSNNLSGFTVYSVANNNVSPPVTISTTSIGSLEQIKTIINCINFPSGEWGADDGVRQPSAKRFSQIEHIRQSNGINLPDNEKAKIRSYNSPAWSRTKQAGYEAFIDDNATDVGAPDMPAPCRAVLDSLGL